MRGTGSVLVLLAAGVAGCGASDHTAPDAAEGAGATAWPGAPIVVTEADDGGRRSLAIGQRLTVVLPSNPMGERMWRIARIDPAIIGQVGHVDFGEDSAVPEPYGSDGAETWTFTGNAAGRAPLVMEYARPWLDAVEPARTFTVTIEVN